MPAEHGEAGDGDETDRLKLDPETVEYLLSRERLGIIADPRRRHVLQALLETAGGVAELDDLVDRVVERERAADHDVPEDHRQRIALSLHHVHLPRLYEANVVEYDWRNGTVRYEGDDVIEACLVAVAEQHDR